MSAAQQLSLPFGDLLREITIGYWRQRNGNTVQVTKLIYLNCDGPKGKFKEPVWKGFCVCCQSPFTWFLTGRYAGVGEHAADIVAPCKPEIVG